MRLKVFSVLFIDWSDLIVIHCIDFFQEKLIKTFGPEAQFTLELAGCMKETMIKDLKLNIKKDYNEKLNLARLFVGSGGQMTSDMINLLGYLRKFKAAVHVISFTKTKIPDRLRSPKELSKENSKNDIGQGRAIENSQKGNNSKTKPNIKIQPYNDVKEHEELMLCPGMVRNLIEKFQSDGTIQARLFVKADELLI